MGQYYHVIVRRNGVDTVYNRTVGDEYTMAKLMEHSWWENRFCRAFASTLVDNPTKVCWCGDYAEEDECSELGFDYNRVWEDDAKAVPIDEADFKMSDVRYLVNNDKKIYVDLAEYYEASKTTDGAHEWCIFPISLLTALGNGRGGGDFHEDYTGGSDVGAWAFDEIYLTNELPKGYTKEEYCFIEE